MKKATKLFVYGSALLTASIGISQNTKEISKSIQENKQQLLLTKQVLEEVSMHEISTLKSLSVYSKQIETREKVITDMDQQLADLRSDIDVAKEEISGITTEITRIKQEFSSAIVSGYKSRKKRSKLHFLFMSESFNDLIKRITYLEKIVDFRRLQLRLIEQKKRDNSLKINKLLLKRKELSALVTEQETAIQKLEEEQKTYTSLVENLRSQKESLREEITRREQRSADLQRELKRVIAEEQRRDKIKATPQVADANSDFKKGSLPWPLKNGYISERFGKHKYEDFKNVTTENNGINIICKPNSSVYPVYSGTVSAVMQVPGMQTSVLIKHDGYYTVYANLSEASCAMGDVVTPSSVIGVVGDNDEGIPEFHFEIWKGTTKLNPEEWISK